MKENYSKQHTDSKQGGEGTNSFNGKSYDPMLKDIGEVENTVAEVPPIDEGTK